MALAVGASLGSYHVLAALGSGGMGEVYRAKDVKLGREVALKILPEGFTHDPERLARFRREAQMLAALNHPHIGAIYGIDEADGVQFLVLELVDGETLERHITRGAMPLDEGLRIAVEIADALAAAHEKGVVHRDLKPANIALTKDGRVKVLDFGLAKSGDPVGATRSELTNLPTITSPAMTGVGTLLGTAAYMSPEQARGHPADQQSDIWAFGCIVYELLTGRRLFSGATVTDTLAAVLTGEPEWRRVPPRARRLLRRCLERDPKQRLHDISDARFLIDEPDADVAPGRSRPWPWVVAGVAIVALALALVLSRPTPVDRGLMRLALDLDPEVAPNALVAAAISPDGTRLVFHTRDGEGRLLLATRRFDEARVTMLTGTEGADQPFFSPDGQWIGFFGGGKLKKVPVQGGTPIPLADARIPRGASWGDDGAIVVALSNEEGLSRVPADGGAPQSLTTLSPGDPTHRWPQVLPGARVLFTANAPTINSYEEATIDVYSFATRQRKTVWRGGYFGRYVPSSGSRGHLVYVRRGVLFAAPFDLDRLEVTGPPLPLLEDVAADPVSGAGQYDFSRGGTFIYKSGAGLRPWIVTWLDASGKTTSLLPKPALYYSPRFSPDGQRLAIGIDDGKGADIFILDLQRDTISRVTFAGQANWDPVWAPDGKHLLFRTGRSGASIWWTRADGVGDPVRLLDGGVNDISANSLSPDGRTWIYSAIGDRGDADLWTLPIDVTDADHPTTGKPALFFHSPGDEVRPAISPDGQWVAYQSTETGPAEVYVRPFSSTASSTGGRWQVSMGGGGQPVWSRTARELFFLTGDRIMVAEYTIADRTFVPGKPRIWSPTRILGNTGFTGYDLAPDGNRFAIFQQSESAQGEERPGITLLLNFFDEIRRRAP